MSPGDSRYTDGLTAIWMGGILSLLCYRAATQAITFDEAATGQAFVDGPLSNAFIWDFGNHLLFTLLAKATTAFLGTSEFALRLPTLLGAVLYVASIWLLGRRVLPSAEKRLACVAILTLNPLVLDFLCAARGYGLALGLFMMAACLLHMAADRGGWQQAWRALIAGALLGLSVTASLPFLTPILGLGAGFALLATLNRRPEKPRWGRVLRVGLCVGLPAGAVSLALLLPHFMQFHNTGGLQSFPGLDSPWKSLRSLFCGAVLSRWCPIWTTRDSEQQGWVGPAADVGAYCLLTGLLVVAGAHAAMAIYRKVRGKSLAGLETSPQEDRRRNLQLLMGAGAVGWLFFAAVLHAAAGVSYPVDRGVIFLVPTLTWYCVLIGRGSRPARQGGKVRLGSWAKMAIALSVAALYALQLRVGWFREWRYDAGSRRVYEQITMRTKGTVAVGSLWFYAPSLSFYHHFRGASQTWLLASLRVESKAEWKSMASVRVSDGNNARAFDYFVLNENEWSPSSGGESALGREVYRDPVSRAILLQLTRPP